MRRYRNGGPAICHKHALCLRLLKENRKLLQSVKIEELVQTASGIVPRSELEQYKNIGRSGQRPWSGTTPTTLYSVLVRTLEAAASDGVRMEARLIERRVEFKRIEMEATRAGICR